MVFKLFQVWAGLFDAWMRAHNWGANNAEPVRLMVQSLPLGVAVNANFVNHVECAMGHDVLGISSVVQRMEFHFSQAW